MNPCKNWDINNMCCMRYTEPDNFSFSISEKDFYPDCKGKADITLCVWFVYRNSTIKDLQQKIKREGLKHGIIRTGTDNISKSER